MTRPPSPRATTALVIALAALALSATPGILTSAILIAQSASPPAPDVPSHPLSLGDAIRFAAIHSATPQTAKLRTAEAQARVRQRRADLLPQVSAAGQQGVHTMNTATFGISFPSEPGQPPLFNPNGEVVPAFKVVDYRGKIEAPVLNIGALRRVGSAQSLVRSSEADALSAGDQAGTVAAMAYIKALRTEDDLRARAADSVLAADLLGIAQHQLDAGVGIALDVTRAKAQVAATRAQLIASRNARDRARVDLLRALNVPLTASLTLSDSLASLTTAGLVTNETQAVQEAVARRPDLRADQERITAAKQGLSAIKMERLPVVSVFGDKGVSGKNYQYLLNTYNYGLQVSLPIFDGLRREGRIQETAAQVREAELQHRDLREQAEADIRSALLDLASTREQVDATREREVLAEQEVTQARERFRAGVAGNADVITASLSLTSARTAVIDALTNYHLARVALARAEGIVTALP